MIPSPGSSFIKYELSNDELKAGVVFSPESRAVMQNLIADAAEEKISLTFDPTQPHIFQQREAELTGQISILKYLLDLQSTFTE